jgi:hypothetical protein
MPSAKKWAPKLKPRETTSDLVLRLNRRTALNGSFLLVVMSNFPLPHAADAAPGPERAEVATIDLDPGRLLEAVAANEQPAYTKSWD